MKNKLLSLMLALIMMLGLLPIGAFAAEPTLAEAIAAAQDGDTITLADGTHTMPGNVSNKNITIKGSKNAVVEMLTAVTAHGSTITFDGVTVKFDNDAYEGLQHSAKVVYKNCTHIGTEFLYAPVVEYSNCDFEMFNDVTEYAVWTYGSKDVTFTDCTFTTHGKAILVYNEETTSSFVAEIKLTNCTFTGDGKFTDKAAIETGSNGGNTATSNKYIITITDCTANGFSANNSTSPLWGNKNNMDVSHLGIETVYVVSWVNYDGAILAEENVAAGETPEYDGETPVKPEDDFYTYEFIGWTPEIGPATNKVTYTANYKAIQKPALPFIVTGVTQVKTIDAETEEALQGATFELYRISSTGSRKLHGTYTSNATGRITARTLSSRFTYELVMTAAPEGYDLLETPIIFRVQYNRPLQQVVPVTKTVVEEAPVEEPAA